MLKAGKPTTAKERALVAVKETETAPEQSKAKLKRFNVDMSEELHRRIKAQAAKEGLSLNELTSRLFNEYLSKVSNE
ncbi:toxin-antitoxin system HicB family antitoxin [Patescibacteria group bacterium]|nr:MAG: toxin-antitoxin system HicB family antitoxin [Patescibacteria group bacterium]